jgi:hypothetical protein
LCHSLQLLVNSVQLFTPFVEQTCLSIKYAIDKKLLSKYQLSINILLL